jgi:hypothetical protein
METITLGDIQSWLGFLLALGASVGAIVHFVKKAIKAVIKPLEDKIDAYGSDNAKNYLVPFLSKVERGEPIDEIELERFHEEYEFYLKHGGNSYVKSRVDKLIKEGKL